MLNMHFYGLEQSIIFASVSPCVFHTNYMVKGERGHQQDKKKGGGVSFIPPPFSDHRSFEEPINKLSQVCVCVCVRVCLQRVCLQCVCLQCVCVSPARVCVKDTLPPLPQTRDGCGGRNGRGLKKKGNGGCAQHAFPPPSPHPDMARKPISLSTSWAKSTTRIYAN